MAGDQGKELFTFLLGYTRIMLACPGAKAPVYLLHKPARVSVTNRLFTQ
jgi:hypothetical protein